MANMQVWLNAIDGKKRLPPRTIDVYSKIKSLGLETVIWEELLEVKNSIGKINSFLEKYQPCLFIYDPISPDVKKGYLFNQRDITQIEKWISENSTEKFSYILTSMIDVKDRGFVGSIFSDGNGNLFCETAHTGDSNHRTLSQSSFVNSKNICRFTAENFDVRSLKGNHLTYEEIRNIIDLYSYKNGFFDFVYGEQAGKWGIYTTGIENSSFPYNVKKDEEKDIGSLILAKFMISGFE